MKQFLAIAGVFALLAVCPLPAQDVMQHDVKHLKVLAENERVRVLKYSPHKGDETLLRPAITHADEALDDVEAIVIELKK